MANPIEQLEAWRAELLTESEELAEELAIAQGEITSAEAKYSDAADEWQALKRLAASGLGSLEDMSEPLFSRLETEGRETLKETSSTLAIIRGRVKALQERIAGRRLGIAQIERALTAAKVATLPPPEPSRRRATVVEYDTITMPEGSHSAS